VVGVEDVGCEAPADRRRGRCVPRCGQ